MLKHAQKASTMTATPPQPLAEIEESEELLKTRIKNEAYMTSNLGYGNAKKRELEVFNTVVWPRLTEAGWIQVGVRRKCTRLKLMWS